MTVYTWRTGTGTWQTAGNWSPGGGPPGAGDTALVFNPATITGTGSAGTLDTSSTGTVTLDGIFNIGSVYDGDVLFLEGNNNLGTIETFISLDLSGAAYVIGDTTAPSHGILQYGGAVTIESGAYVQASLYSMIPYYTPTETLTIDGTLDIPTFAAYQPGTSYLTGGMSIGSPNTPAAYQVTVQNGGSLSTSYLTMEDPDAVLTVNDGSADVTQTSASTLDLGPCGHSV